MNKRALVPLAISAILIGCGGSEAPQVTITTQKVQAATVVAVSGNIIAFPGNRADYVITATGSGFSVSDVVGTGAAVSVTAAQRLQFADVNVALDVAGNGGKLYRVYQAAFDRVPDAAGLGFWIGVTDGGVTIEAAAADFLASNESVLKYGASPTNAALVTGVYTNVLHRAPDQAGYNYWLAALENKLATRAQFLALVAESDENKANVAAAIATGFSYVPTTRIAANTVPGAPVIGAATAGNGAASIAFTPPSKNGGVPITGYTARCAANGAVVSSGAGSSPISLAGLSNGTVYTCTVIAANSLGNSAASGTVTVTPVAPVVVVTVPGPPTIVSATPGNATAAIAFTAPASNGGAAISTYTASCTGGGATKTASGVASPITVSSLTNLTVYSCSVKASNAAGSGAASGALSVTPTAGITSGTTTGAVFCAYSSSVLNATLNLTSTVAIACSEATARRTMTGNGVPDHFANPTNPGKIAAVTVNFVSTLNPVATATSTPIEHITGYANNGVKFDPSTAESYQNAGVWKIEALNQSYFPFGTDGSNAHIQPSGAYHYHGMPEKYIETLNKGTGMALIGFAMDGFPIYARYGYKTASDASSGTKVITSSYRLKAAASAGRPATSIVPMGTFTQDYEYVAGLGDLDECNGRTGVTPEFPNGIYHYYVTDSYPYIQRCMKGTAIPAGPK